MRAVRVAEQELRRALAGVAGGGKHALEHRRRAAGIHAGTIQVVDSQAIGFLLILAAVAQRFIEHGGLGGSHRRHARIAADGGGQHQAGEQSREADGRRAALCIQAAGEVPLAEVGEFVGQDRGQFVLAARLLKQPGVDTDHTTRHRKGIERWVFDDDQL